MMNLLLVGLGGFCGAISRYLLGLGISSVLPSTKFPIGVMAANILGSFLIGLFWGISNNNPSFRSEYSLFLIVGVLGGFTTFSSFSLDNLKLLSQGMVIQAIMNIVISVVVGLLVTWLGFLLSKHI